MSVKVIIDIIILLYKAKLIIFDLIMTLLALATHKQVFETALELVSFLSKKYDITIEKKKYYANIITFLFFIATALTIIYKQGYRAGCVLAMRGFTHFGRCTSMEQSCKVFLAYSYGFACYALLAEFLSRYSTVAVFPFRTIHIAKLKTFAKFSAPCSPRGFSLRKSDPECALIPSAAPKQAGAANEPAKSCRGYARRNAAAACHSRSASGFD